MMVAARRKDVRRGRADIDTVWDDMDRYQRFQLLDQVGAQILPVLVALPDIEVAPGTRPTYTDVQVREAVEGLGGEGMGKLRRNDRRQGAHRAGAVGAQPRAATSRSRRSQRA